MWKELAAKATSVLKSSRLKRAKTFWGRLGGRLVESDKKVIVYDIRGVLHASDSVDAATEFYARLQSENQIGSGGVFLHDTEGWQRVQVPEKKIR